MATSSAVMMPLFVIVLSFKSLLYIYLTLLFWTCLCRSSCGLGILSLLCSSVMAFSLLEFFTKFFVEVGFYFYLV